MDNSNIDNIIKQSIDKAVELSHEYCTLEHVTVSLLNNKKIIELCKELKIVVNDIQTDLKTYLDNDEFNGLVAGNGFKFNLKKLLQLKEYSNEHWHKLYSAEEKK